MEYHTRFELVPSAWKADMLAVNTNGTYWVEYRDLNPNLTEPQSAVLPLHHTPHFKRRAQPLLARLNLGVPQL